MAKFGMSIEDPTKAHVSLKPDLLLKMLLKHSRQTTKRTIQKRMPIPARQCKFEQDPLHV